jgi:hypothetical protein
MNLHTFKWTPTLGIGISMESWIFKEQSNESKPIGLKISLYHWKSLETLMFKMGLHDPFGHLKHKLWPKEGPGIKVPIWFSTIKSQESPTFPCVRVTCDILLESPWQGLQLYFRPHLNWRFAHKVMGPQSCGSSSCGNFRTPTWES